MQSICMLLVLFAVVSGTSAANLRSGPPPAPAPMASPGPAPELTPEEAVEEAHHTTAVTRGEYIVDKAGRELDKAHVMSAKAAKFVAKVFGDKDAVKEAKEKVVEQQAQVKKSAEETQESKDAFKAAKSAYQHAEVAADNAETSNAKKASSKEAVVKLLKEVEDAVKEADSFVQVESKVAKKGVGFDGFGTPDPFNQNDDDQVDAGEPNAPDAENPNDDANMVSDEDGDDDDSFVQVASKRVAKKGDGFDGFGTTDPSNQNDDDQVDVGELGLGEFAGRFEHLGWTKVDAPDAENPTPTGWTKVDPNDDADMVSDDDGDDDDSFVQVASKKLAKKGDGFDGFGTPDPFNQNDDDQVDAGGPNAPDAENPNDDANMVSDDDDSGDDSFMQVASKRFLAKMNQIKKQFLAKAVGPH